MNRGQRSAGTTMDPFVAQLALKLYRRTARMIWLTCSSATLCPLSEYVQSADRLPDNYFSLSCAFRKNPQLAIAERPAVSETATLCVGNIRPWRVASDRLADWLVSWTSFVPRSRPTSST